MNPFRKAIDLKALLSNMQRAAEQTVVTARDEFIEQAERDATETVQLPGSPTKLSIIPQDQLLPAKLVFLTSEERWRLEDDTITGTLEVVWRLREAPELTARLKDDELSILDLTLSEVREQRLTDARERQHNG